MSSKLEILHKDWPDRRYPQFGVKAEGVELPELVDLSRKYGFAATNVVGGHSAPWRAVPKAGAFWELLHSDGIDDLVSVLWCSSEEVYDGRSTGFTGLDLGVSAMRRNIGIVKEAAKPFQKEELEEIEKTFGRFETDSTLTVETLHKVQKLRSINSSVARAPAEEFIKKVRGEAITHEHVWRYGDMIAVSSSMLHCRMNGYDRSSILVVDIPD
jgi:hypothetical protein